MTEPRSTTATRFLGRLVGGAISWGGVRVLGRGGLPKSVTALVALAVFAVANS